MDVSPRSPTTSEKFWRTPKPELFLCGLIWVAGGCASLRAGGESVSPHARLYAIADSRTQDTMFIDSALSSADPYLRADAALAVGQLRMRSRAPRLRDLLASSDTGTAANAAFALGLLRDSASTDALTSALLAEPVIAVEAAWALGEIGARSSLENALARFADSSAGSSARAAGHHPRVVTAVLLAATKLRPVPVRHISRFLGTDADSVGWAASYAVTRLPTPAAARALLALAVSPDAMVRANVARGLSVRATGDSLAEQAATVLTTLAADRNPHVRVNAVRSLATFGPRHMTTVFRLMRDPDANVRIAAAQSIPPIPVGISDSAWTGAWLADTTFAYRQSLLIAAARHGHIMPVIAEWSRAADWRMRAAVTDAVAASHRSRLVDSVVTPMLSDADVRVRVRALRALSAAFDSIPTVAARVRRALDDPQPDVRGTAIDVLGDNARATATEVPRILDLYTAASADTTNAARISALGYIASAWQRDSLNFGGALRTRISALPEPTDPEERQRVAGLRLLAHWKSVPGTARPLSWYEQRYRDLVRPARAGRPPRAQIETERGTITVALFAADAPLTVHNFVTLARSGYYRDVRFHRVVPNFVAQAGDPTGAGSGGPGYAIRDELNRRRYRRGALGMALSGPDTGGSQWFITHSPQPHLDGGYTVFGQVTAGWDVLDALVQGDRIVRITIR